MFVWKCFNETFGVDQIVADELTGIFKLKLRMGGEKLFQSFSGSSGAVEHVLYTSVPRVLQTAQHSSNHFAVSSASLYRQCRFPFQVRAFS